MIGVQHGSRGILITCRLIENFDNALECTLCAEYKGTEGIGMQPLNETKLVELGVP